MLYKNKHELSRIRRIAMGILAGREHSALELKSKLLKKDFSAALVDTLIDDLINDNLLNEGRFVASFIRSRIEKGQGQLKIRHELRLRGIDDELIDDYLDTSYEFWQPYIKQARSKRFGNTIPKDYKEQGRQSRFLYQRGFDAEHIKRCISLQD